MLFCDDGNIGMPRQKLGMKPKEFAKKTPYAIANDRLADFSGYGRSRAGFRPFRKGIPDEEKKMGGMPAQAFLVTQGKIRLAEKADSLGIGQQSGHEVGGGQTVPFQALRRLRPFARRRRRMARPLGVAMRTRKPWLRALFILLGWYVLFICLLLQDRDAHPLRLISDAA